MRSQEKQLNQLPWQRAESDMPDIACRMQACRQAATCACRALKDCCCSACWASCCCRLLSRSWLASTTAACKTHRPWRLPRTSNVLTPAHSCAEGRADHVGHTSGSAAISGWILAASVGIACNGLKMSTARQQNQQQLVQLQHDLMHKLLSQDSDSSLGPCSAMPVGDAAACCQALSDPAQDTPNAANSATATLNPF